MRAVDIVIKKRDKKELTKEEIVFFIHGLVNGDIPDYQVSAWAMAVLLNGMTEQETTDLTLAMADSGEVLDLSVIAPIVIDKHSTGGVGDKTTLVVGPIVAACGLPVGKMSGRGLGFSGGTLDKMESIPGYRVDLSREEFLSQLKAINIVLTGQSADLAPADGKLYALRDVTGTVPSLPLIASSIMSKKIAAGARAIVLDVKAGNGAFMKNAEEAKRLAEMMVAIGKLSGREVRAVISDMNQPLGEAVGNAVELKEAIDTLHNKGPRDFLEHCLVIASHMLVLGKKAKDLNEAREIAINTLENRSAWEKFRKLVIAQNGDVSFIDDPKKLPEAPIQHKVKADRTGFISQVNARTIGETSVGLGAGRAKKTDQIDLGVGILVHRKVGDKVNKDDVLFTILSNNYEKAKTAEIRLKGCVGWSDIPCNPLPSFYGVIS
ncbi:MAG: pyrimidine-nucleoside phosphorylase [Anaerolineaceae bacterium]|nr:pyrimidine-nucleoside phosphorylase [Anaerolineaceae bacterium]